VIKETSLKGNSESRTKIETTFDSVIERKRKPLKRELESKTKIETTLDNSVIKETSWIAKRKSTPR